MQTHLVGPITGTREGAALTAQSFSMDYLNNLSGVSVLLTTIKASSIQPVLMRLTMFVMVTDNSGTSAIANLGNVPAGTQYAAVDMQAIVGTTYGFYQNNLVYILTNDTPIYFQSVRVGTAATAGQMVIVLELAEINITQPSNQGT